MVHGSQVNLVHLIGVCATCIELVSGVVVCAGGASTYKLYYFVCINMVALLKAFVAWKIRWVVVNEKTLIDIHMISPSSNKICNGPNWLLDQIT